MKVHHLSTNDIGGAARAAIGLHSGLRLAGVDSKFIVRNQRARVDACHQLPSPKPTPESHSLPARILRKFRGGNRTKQPEPSVTYYSSSRSPYRTTELAEFGAPDVYNLHWVAGMLDWPGMIPDLASQAPLVWTLHDLNPGQGIWHYEPFPSEITPELESLDGEERRLKQRVMGSIAPSRLRIVGPSRWISSFARQSEILGRFKVNTIPYGIDTSVFHPVEKSLARAALGVNPGRRIVGMIADNLGDERKGSRHLNEALQSMGNEQPLVVTVGKTATDASFSYERLNLGPLANDGLIRLFYSALDLFVCPSLQDNLPNTVLESMACGTPVIGSNVGGIPDMVRPGETGWLFPAGDATALAAALREALDHPEQCSDYGHNARQVCEKEYTLETQAKAYLKLYQEMLAG